MFSPADCKHCAIRRDSESPGVAVRLVSWKSLWAFLVEREQLAAAARMREVKPAASGIDGDGSHVAGWAGLDMGFTAGCQGIDLKAAATASNEPPTSERQSSYVAFRSILQCQHSIS